MNKKLLVLLSMNCIAYASEDLGAEQLTKQSYQEVLKTSQVIKGTGGKGGVGAILDDEGSGGSGGNGGNGGDGGDGGD